LCPWGSAKLAANLAGVHVDHVIPYSSLEIYSKISLRPAQDSYDGVIDRFPV